MHKSILREENDFSKSFSEFIDLIEKMNVIPPELYEQYNVKRGLRNADGTGVLVGLTVIGNVHGYIIDDDDRKPAHGRLSYRGIDVKEIVKGCDSEHRFGFEEVCYLILFGILPNKKQLETFTSILTQLRALPNGFVEDMILKAPSPNIMNKLARSVLALYSYDDNAEDMSVANTLVQSMGLIAKIPILIANSYAVKRHVYDDQSLIIHTPAPNLSTAENFLYMLRPNHEYTREEAEILDLCLILHAEHGGGNNSSFTTHVVSSSGTDTYSAIASAVCSLKGPKHGGAAANVSRMFDDIKANVKDWSDENEIGDYITKIINKQAFDKSGLVYGIGHAVYTLSDPRAVLLKSKAQELAKIKGREQELYLYEAVEKLTPSIFAREKKNSKVVSANVDFYSGLVYSMLGIEQDLYTPMFAMSRIVGWCAHRIEELVSGGRIIRPAYKSIAQKSHYVPMEKR